MIMLLWIRTTNFGRINSVEVRGKTNIVSRFEANYFFSFEIPTAPQQGAWIHGFFYIAISVV